MAVPFRCHQGALQRDGLCCPARPNVVEGYGKVTIKKQSAAIAKASRFRIYRSCPQCGASALGGVRSLEFTEIGGENLSRHSLVMRSDWVHKVLAWSRTIAF